MAAKAPKGECPCCRAKLSVARIVVKRVPGSNPNDMLAPTLEVSCKQCFAFLDCSNATDDAGPTIICDDVEVMRAIERFKRASADERLLGELEMWRISRALEVPEVFAFVKHLYKGPAELVDDAIFEIADHGEQIQAELARSRQNRILEDTLPRLLSRHGYALRFLLPAGCPVNVMGIAGTWLLLQKPKALPFPEGTARISRRVSGLLAPPSLLRPDRP